MKCNETLSKWCKNKHGASKIIDTFETYHPPWHWSYTQKEGGRLLGFAREVNSTGQAPILK
jgi:hypothetical protein